MTKIEFLGWHRHTRQGFEKCERLIEPAKVYPLNDSVALEAIRLKRKSKIRLADAVIAARALVNGFTLATTNTDGFKGVAGLKILNPLA